MSLRTAKKDAGWEKSFKARHRVSRIESGLSQAEIAQILGIPTNTYAMTAIHTID